MVSDLNKLLTEFPRLARGYDAQSSEPAAHLWVDGLERAHRLGGETE